MGTNTLFMSRLGKYFQDTAAEMKHVSWPTQSQAVVYSILVIAISALTAVYTGVFDYLFTSLLNIVL